MVSLVVFADGAAFPAGLEKREVSGRDAYVWREGRGGYMLMADRMAPGRLALVARTVHEAVRRRAPLGPEGTRLLIASREQMPPCTA